MSAENPDEPIIIRDASPDTLCPQCGQLAALHSVELYNVTGFRRLQALVHCPTPLTDEQVDKIARGLAEPDEQNSNSGDVRDAATGER